MVKKQKTHPKVSPDQVRRYKRLAEQIDREEKDEIKKMGRSVFRNHALMTDILSVLRELTEQQSFSLSDLAAQLEMDRSNLWRLFNEPDQNPTLETLLRIGEALNVDLLVTARPRKAG